MATVPHVISGLGLGKFQADGLLLTRVCIFSEPSFTSEFALPQNRFGERNLTNMVEL